METEDFGFHDFDTAFEHGEILVLSGYHILPRAGGWDDQYETDSQDIKTFLRGLVWARNLKSDEKTNDTESISEADGIVDNGGDWMTGL